MELSRFNLPSARVRQTLLDVWGRESAGGLARGGELYRQLADFRTQHCDKNGIPRDASGNLTLLRLEAPFRPHLIEAAVNALPKLEERMIVEFYYGAFLSGPLAFSDSPYVQVSHEPKALGLDTLPAEFLKMIGLPSLAELNLASFAKMLNREELGKIALIQKTALPKLVQVNSTDQEFSSIEKMQELFDLYLEINCGSGPDVIHERLVRPGGYLMFMFQNEAGFPVALNRAMRGSRKLMRLSARITRMISGTPGFDLSRYQVSVYQKL